MVTTVDTKERILLTALDLFAKDGYEAVSISTIAREIGMAKSALYKHYQSKRDIFDSILLRMSQMDSDRANDYEVPDGTAEEMPQAYEETQLGELMEFSKAQFKYWTENEFASAFRRMLTLEQYRSQEMSGLFHQYLGTGPLEYTEDLFYVVTSDRAKAKLLAVRFYGPMFLLYSIYDNAEDKSAVTKMLQEHVDTFTKNHFNI